MVRTPGLETLAARLLPLLWLLALPAAVHAQFTFTTNDNVITITGYSGPGGTVVIPSATNGWPVTTIGPYAFQNNTTLTNVTIPYSVTNIGDGAFVSCTSLTNVTIGTNVLSIGQQAFDDCTGLPGVLIPKSVTVIGSSAFAGCTGLAAITVDALNSRYSSSADGVLFNTGQIVLIQYPAGRTATQYTVPSSVVTIGDWAFYNSANLASVIITNNVTSIGNYAFDYCPNLVSVTLSNNVLTIGQSAFEDCASLTNVMIPKSVTSIGSGAFTGCTSLNAIPVASQNTNYLSTAGVLFNKAQTFLIEYPGGKAGGYAIPSGVTNLGPMAFEDCTSVTSITIPNTVTSIGDYAFNYCTSLTNLTIPNTVTSIGSGAFSFAGALATLTIPDSVTYLGDFAFEGCSARNVSIGNGITSIGNLAFYSCSSLTNVTLGSGVTNLQDRAFEYCSSLIGIYFRGDAPSLGGPSVFTGDSNVTLYYLPGARLWDTFAGPTAVLWRPRVETGGASFGVRTNQFGFNINWASGRAVVVDACTNLATHNWSPAGTNTLTSDSSYFSDAKWTNYTRRFYRLRWP